MAAMMCGLAVGCSGDDAADPVDAPAATTTTSWEPRSRVTVDSFDPERWMEDLAPQIGDRPLSELHIPGTHDAGTFSLSRTDPVLSVAQNDAPTDQFEGIPLLRVADYVYTQNLSFAEQLDLGIRYLDVRLTCEPDGMYIVHVFRGEPMVDALDQIATWVDEHPAEVVLLDVQKNYGCDEQTYEQDGRQVSGNDAFTEAVRNAFGARLASRPAGADVVTTLDGLVAAGTNVVAFFIEPSYAEQVPEYWLRTSNALPPGAGLMNVWQPIATMPEMFSHLVSEGPSFAGRGPSQMTLAALTTSPMFPKETGISACYRASLEGGCVSSLRQFVTERVLPAMPVMVATAADAGYNVLSTDYFELGQWPGGASFAQLVVEQN